MASMNNPANNIPPALIIFDLGGVLLDWNPRYLYHKFFPGDEQAMERFFEEVGFTEWNKAQDAGRPFAQGVDELCASHPQYCGLIRAYDERFQESLGGAIPGTVEILRRLHAAGRPLWALSNWSAEKFRLVRPAYAFLELFESIVISGDVGVNKPEKRIFQVLLQQSGREAGECLFIDDSQANISAAQGLGFQCILFQDPALLEQELISRGLLGA
jgi:2-haloacid dehalogenase